MPAAPNPCDPCDPSQPAIWWLMTLRAIVGIQRRNNEPAVAYLQFVEKHRGRAVAEGARTSLRRLASTAAFSEAAAVLCKLENTAVAAQAPAPAKTKPTKGKRPIQYARGVIV